MNNKPYRFLADELEVRLSLSIFFIVLVLSTFLFLLLNKYLYRLVNFLI